MRIMDNLGLKHIYLLEIKFKHYKIYLKYKTLMILYSLISFKFIQVKIIKIKIIKIKIIKVEYI